MFCICNGSLGPDLQNILRFVLGLS